MQIYVDYIINCARSFDRKLCAYLHISLLRSSIAIQVNGSIHKYYGHNNVPIFLCGLCNLAANVESEKHQLPK